MTLYRRQGSRPSPWEKNAEKAKWLSEEALQIAVKRREGSTDIIWPTELPTGKLRVLHKIMDSQLL